jgi:hypothetical protein
MKQPFYHRMEVLFTATGDVSAIANTEWFRVRLANFLHRNLKKVIKSSVVLDDPVDAEAGDPRDL